MAQHSHFNDTRVHPDAWADPGAPLLTDRERVIHSSAFRRLQYKTQAFVASREDHFRTRLTHTLEVAHLARKLAQRLGLRADLAEVVALAHDLGHAPFGHAGERALDECLGPIGGFEHNAHALRVVDYLEHPYPAFRGLNLTHVVRECLAKHSTRFDQPGASELQDGLPPALEGQAAALADRLAYALHDLQDALYAGLLDVDALASLELWRAGRAAAGLPPGDDWRGSLRPTVERMQQILLDDVCAAAAQATHVHLSAASEQQLQELETCLLERVYRHHLLVRYDAKARRIILAVFEAYTQEPRLLPERYAARVPQQGVARVAGDYIAGMTDRYCLQEHRRLFDPEMEL